MKRNHLTILFAGVLLLMASCKGFLDLEPKSVATDENFWKTQDDANSAVAGMYSLLRDAFNNAGGVAYFAYGDFATDQFTGSNAYPYNDMITMNWGLPLSLYDTGNSMYLLRRYDRFYRIIDQANRVIKFIPEMDPEEFDNERARNFLLGEAYYMRAFTYFYMGRIWGGVPLITEAIAPIYAENHAAATAEEVMQQSLADLEKAKELLDWENLTSADFAVRANKGAAFALEAHVQAWTGNYEASAAAADSVIKSGLYYYVSRDSIPYHTIFEGNSSEGIFEVSQNEANEGTSAGIGDYTLAGTKYHRNYTVPRLTITKAHIKTLFDDPADKRLTFTYDTTVSNSFVICNKYANLTYSDETNNAVTIYKNNIVVFRYSDIKLLRAEALAMTGNTAEARTVLDEVRLQSGLQPWEGEGSLIEAIFDERARELFLEGHRYYDMVRLYKHGGVYAFDNGRMSEELFNRGKYLWPFDPSLLNQNPLLRQTAYWATVNL